MDLSEAQFEKDYKEIENKVIPGQRWIALRGAYTPEQLRALANKIEKEFAKIEEKNGIQKRY